METILKIGRKLPKPIKIPLARIYHSQTPKIDKKMAKDLSEYFALDPKEIIWLLRSGERLNANLWKILNPRTEAEVEEFYKTCPFYVFELAFWHMKGYQRRFRSKIIKFAKGKVLDFGGGIGDLSIALKKKGFDCNYADLGGRIFEFAKWLFQKRGLDIEMINLSRGGLLKTYDTIFCIDVIEHSPNPKGMLKNLANHLTSSGRLIITNLNAPVLKRHPMHFPMKFDGEKYLNSLGLFKDKEPWLWIKS